MDKVFGVVKACVGGFNDLHSSGSYFAYAAAVLYIISTLIIFIQNIFTFANSSSVQGLSEYDPTALQVFFESLATYAKSDCFLRILDTISSLMIIPVANNLQAYLGNSIMSRVMAGCAIGGSLVNMFEGLFSCGLVEVASRLGVSWGSKDYHAVVYLIYQQFDNATQYVFTIDSLLFAFFLFVLGYLSHEKSEINRGFGYCAIIGGISGMLSFVVLLFQAIRSIFLYFVSEFFTVIENICLIVCLFWIGKIFKNASTLPK